MDISGEYDRLKEIKAFDASKAGVKGLVDAGVVKIPKMFIRPADELAEELNCHRTDFRVPVIDFNGIEIADRRLEIVEEIQDASEKWGFFQVVNHGIPIKVLHEMIDGVRMFHEQDVEVKKQFHSRNPKAKVQYSSNFDLYKSRHAQWRDTFAVSMPVPDQVHPHELPASCRDSTIEYIKHVTMVRDLLLELLSEALGLKSEYLKDLECDKGHLLICNYYPACPEPELTLGAGKHSDPSFLTILFQDYIGGLQFLHENQWADVPPIPGALVVNIGDLLQIVSNDKFKSVEHRAVSKLVGPRVSLVSFFYGDAVSNKVYSPIKEVLSKDNPAAYKSFTVSDYNDSFYSKPLHESRSCINCYRV